MPKSLSDFIAELHQESKVLPTEDGGVSWTPVQKYVTSADLTAGTTAITNAVGAGLTVVIDDLLISVGSVAQEITILMETSGNVLASVFLPISGTVQLTFRNGLKADAAAKTVLVDASAAGNVRITCSYHLV